MSPKNIYIHRDIEQLQIGGSLKTAFFTQVIEIFWIKYFIFNVKQVSVTWKAFDGNMLLSLF